MQGFGQKFVDASGNTLGTISIKANAISRVAEEALEPAGRQEDELRRSSRPIVCPCGTPRGRKTNEPGSATSDSSPQRTSIRPSELEAGLGTARVAELRATLKELETLLGA